MNKEDTRAELENDIRSLEERLLELNNAEIPDIGEISKIEDLLDEKKNALEEMTTEMAQNSGTDLKKAKVKTQEEKEKKDEDLDKKEQDENEQDKKEQDKNEQDENEQDENEQDRKEQDEKEQEEIKQERKEDETQGRDQETEEKQIDEVELEEEQEIHNDGPKLTLSEWQVKTGIDIVADEYIKQKYGNEILQNGGLTEEQFIEILANENVPKVVLEPGKAENYLKSSEDWECVRSSMSAINQAIKNNNFPVDVNEESFVLVEYYNDRVYDKNENRDEQGFSQIGEEDFRGVNHEEAEEVSEKKEELTEELEEDSGLNKVDIDYRNGMYIINTLAAIEAVNSLNNNINVPLAMSVVSSGALCGKEAEEKGIVTLIHDSVDPEKAKEELMQETEIAPDDEYQIRPPIV